jgi:AraC-like DNA-binding protein
MPVTLVAQKSGAFQFSADIPEYLQPYVVQGSQCQAAEGSFGYILLQQLQAQQFQIQFNRYCFSNNEQINFLSREPMLELLFNLDTPISYHMEGLGNLSFLKSSYNLIYLPVIDNDSYVESNTTYQTLSVQFPFDYLASIASHFPVMNELLKKISMRQPGTLFQLCPGMPVEVLNIIHEILKGKYSGDLLQVYLTARITEMLFLCLEQQVAPASTASIRLWKSDLDGIEATRRDMLQNPHQIFNLPELALKAGMNKDKLSKGFRLVIGTHLYDYLLQARMSKARWLLLTTAYAVSAVGFEVGYQDIRSFSKAFKKYYGLSPQQYRKKFDKWPLN